MAKKKHTLDPNRFQKKGEQRFLALDPTRKELLKWGIVAGVVGGFFLIQNGFIWQILGFLAIFFISSFQIDKAARRIPRWHAVLFSLFGTMPAMLLVIIIGNLILAYLGDGAAG